MNNNDTNIISDDDFLKEIFNNVKVEESAKPELSEIDKILLGEEEGKTTTEEPKGDKTDDGEESKGSQASEESEESEIDKEEKSTLKRFGVKDTISTLIENEIWVDMPIKYGDKEYDNIEELIEKEKPSKELFELLSQAQKSYRETQLNESYIKIEDKNSTKAKLVQAILNDVDYSDLLKYNEDVIEPLQAIDFANIENGDRIAESFVRQCLIDIDNYHPESVDAVIEKLKRDFRIIEKAEQYQEITIEKFNEEIENRKLERDQFLKQEAEERKKEMRALREELKQQSLSDAFSTKILKLRYTQDPNTGNYHYQELIKDKLKDKNFEARLMHFLLDDRDFIEKEKAKVKTETSKKYLELMNITPSNKGGVASKKPSGNLQSEDEDFLREIGLIKD